MSSALTSKQWIWSTKYYKWRKTTELLWHNNCMCSWRGPLQVVNNLVSQVWRPSTEKDYTQPEHWNRLVGIMNANKKDQVLTKDTILGYWDPVVWLMSAHSLNPKLQGDSRPLQPAENLQRCRSSPTIRCHSQMMHEDRGDALEKACFNSPETLMGRKGTSPYASLHSNNTQTAGMVFCNMVLGDPPCQGTAWWTLWVVEQHSSTSEHGQQQDEGPLWLPSQIHGISGRRLSPSALPELDHRKLVILQSSWDGPYKVIIQISKAVYRITLRKTNTISRTSSG